MEPSEHPAEPDPAATPVKVDAAVLLLVAGVTAAKHPLVYVRLLIQVGHEPLPPTVGTMFGRRVLYLPGFFSYARHIVSVDGKRGLFRGVSPCVLSSLVSTVVRGKTKQVRLRTGLMSVRLMAQFVGREVKYSGIFSCVIRIFKEEGLSGFYVGLLPHLLGEVLLLWCRNLLAHFINSYAVDENVSVVGRSQIGVGLLMYPFMLVADVMAVNNCGLAAGLPPRSPVFRSWLHCWNHLSQKGHLFRGSSLFFRQVPVTSMQD
uniref:Mitochondrial carrier 1 n=1 Tax=Oryzias melastigma TaxID=30732 RepID=A0A3B3E262_ORYME